MSSVKMETDFKGLEEKIAAAALEALSEIASDLLNKSKSQAPVESGELKAGAAFAQSDSGKITMRIGYSGPYAIRQHEDLTLRHDRTDGHKTLTGKTAGESTNMIAGGKAKYLEDPFNENIGDYLSKIGEKIRGVTGG